jgi:hypothetical protein
MVGVISALLSQGQLQANPITAPKPIIIGVQTSRKKTCLLGGGAPAGRRSVFF